MMHRMVYGIARTSAYDGCALPFNTRSTSACQRFASGEGELSVESALRVKVTDARHITQGAQRTTESILSEGSSLSPGKRLHHQRSSSSHDASPHPQDPLNSAFLDGRCYAVCSSLTHTPSHSSTLIQ
jgi:hypothetical protein